MLTTFHLLIPRRASILLTTIYLHYRLEYVHLTYIRCPCDRELLIYTMGLQCRVSADSRLILAVSLK